VSQQEHLRPDVAAESQLMEPGFQLREEFYLGVLELFPERIVMRKSFVDSLAMYPCPSRRGPDIAAVRKGGKERSMPYPGCAVCC